MAQGGVSGIGVKVGINLVSGSPTGFTTIQNILDCTLPQLIANKIDKTVYGTSRVKRSVPGLIEVSDLQVVLIQDLDTSTSPEQASLAALNQNGNKIGVRIEVAVNTALSSWVPITWTGYVASWQLGSKKDDIQQLTVAIFFDDSAFTIGSPGASIL